MDGVNLDVCTHIYMFIRVIKHVQKEVPTGTGMAVYLSSDGNIIGLIYSFSSSDTHLL